VIGSDPVRASSQNLSCHNSPIPTNHDEGPWHLGRLSKPIGAVACSFVLLMIPVLCFPATKGKDLNRLNMNYSCLIYGGSMFLALMWYAIDARKWFKGPKVNVEHLLTVPQLESQAKSDDGSHEFVGNNKLE
jgi:hypothetical protein